MTHRARVLVSPCLVLAAALACGDERSESPAPAAPAPAPTAATASPAPPQAAAAPAPLPPDLPRGLLVALSQFEVSPQGKVLPKPGPARLEILVRRGGAWAVEVIEDPESNVFHKAMAYVPNGQPPGIATLGGTKAAIKLWRKRDGRFEAETLWSKDFGGKFSRMRDAEIADVMGKGSADLAVATHDQGVVAVVSPKGPGAWDVQEVDQEKDTFVHEIEVGDLDGDGIIEIYATPSEPNRLDGTPQSGKVTRYVPARGEGRVVVADLGARHAKEILVRDVDGDGRDELYVAVEAATEGTGAEMRIVEPVEIRRYDAGTDPEEGVAVARIDDRLCRVLTAGDVDGDGRKEIVAAAFKSGLWLLRPGAEAGSAWSVTSIDRASSGFEHAAILTDLDGDGRDELYVASDDQGEVRRYVWQDGRFASEVIHRRAVPGSALSWNLMPVAVELLQ
jgi:hypothetical protein